MLGLFAGSDAVATTLIVGSFLFGLGLGSLAGGWLADRLSPRAALQAFGVAELGVGVFAVLSPWILYGVVFHRLEPLAASLAGATLVTFAALALPTVLMGMTLPFIARALVQRIDLSPMQIGALYGVNTAGAGIGCLLTGFVLIAALGYGGSVRLAGEIDIAVALGAMILSGALDARPTASRIEAGPTPDAPRRGLMLRWMVLVFLSGFLAISLEILWFRVLGTLMRSSAYSFSLVLGVFLLADALGILLGSYHVRRVVDPERLFLWLQGAVGVWALGSLLAIYLAHTWLGAAALFIDGPPYGPPQRELLRLLLFAVLVGAVVAPAAVALGATFPIVQKAIQHRSSLIGWRLGLVQLANIMGNTAGAVVTGLVILRYVGASGAFHVVGLLACLALLALALVRRPGGILRRPVRLLGHAVRLARWPALSAMAAALLVLLVALPGNARLWSGLHGTPRGRAAIVRSGEAGVAVLRPTGNGYILFVNGAFQAHLEPPLPLQTREPISEALGAIGPLVHPQASAALLVGYGAGNTVFNLGAGPAMACIRVVEIARPVIEAMRAVAASSGFPVASEPFEDPRIERVIADGRHVLFTEPERYDIIVAETIAPRTAGSNLLFSKEFFEEVRSRLKPGGLAVQWAVTPRTVATFLSVFPYALRLNGVLLGSDRPIDLDWSRLGDELGGPPGQVVLRSGVAPEALLAYLRNGPQGRWGPGDPRPDTSINTDLHPRDEFYPIGW